MNFVIVGGGPTGVELAGALAEIKKGILPKDYPDLDTRRVEPSTEEIEAAVDDTIADAVADDDEDTDETEDTADASASAADDTEDASASDAEETEAS